MKKEKSCGAVICRMKRWFTLLITLCLVLSWGHMPAPAEEVRLEGDPWINSNLYGRWPSERPAPEEQFELYANFDEYRAAFERGDKAESSLLTRGEKTNRENIMALCTDPDRTDAECECIRILYGFMTDQESIRNSGFSSLMTRVERVRGVKTPDELTALMQEEGFLFCSPFFSCNLSYPQANDVGQYVFYVSRSCELDTVYPSEEELLANPWADTAKDTEGARRKLMRMGYGEEEASELVQKLVWFEDENIAEQINMPSTDLPDEEIHVSAEQIRTLCPPLYAMLKGQGYIREGMESEPVYIITPEEGRIFCCLYTEENLELLKAVIALSFYRSAESFLGPAAFPELDDSPVDILSQLDTFCRPLITQAYFHNYIPMERIEESLRLFEEIKGVLRARIKQSSWASDQTKENALRKLESMRHNDMIYRQEFDFEPLHSDLRSCSCLVDAAERCMLFNRQCSADYAGRESIPGDRYLETFNPISADGRYDPYSNSFSIGFGALCDDMYDDTSRETVLATLGATLAHEASHGFDNNGMYFDANGRNNPLWTESDMQLYMDRANAIAERAEKIKLLDDLNVMGHQQLYEIIADMQGIRLLLDLAAKEEHFDYDVFFRRYARWHRSYYVDREEYREYFATSMHPSPYVRVNFTLQAMDEFYQTYPSVTEGTPMYLPPEERFFVW